MDRQETVAMLNTLNEFLANPSVVSQLRDSGKIVDRTAVKRFTVEILRGAGGQ